jgi:citrate synthase
MSQSAVLKFKDKEYKMNVVVGTENERGVDISKLRTDTGMITLDNAYGNTGSCQSRITYIDGEKGILRYRGYDVEDLANHSTVAENAYLLIFGELPTKEELAEWSDLLTENELLHESLQHHFEAFPPNAHPMAILSAMINASSCFYPELTDTKTHNKDFKRTAARLVSQIRTIAAFSYKKSIGQPIVYPRPELKYAQNFLHMMFSLPYRDYDLNKDVVDALRRILILHADHEQNCSTSTVRMVGSSKANLYASVAAGVCALWGPRHGGANEKVLDMLTRINERGLTVKEVVERVKNRKMLLMGFGHRVYKNHDPRATILKDSCHKVFEALGVADPLLDIALELEDAALNDDFFIERNLYPNVDFYSGIIFKAIGIPTSMFTVLFAIGRVAGWVAHWAEVSMNPRGRIYRPRQIYQGSPLRPYTPMHDRKQGDAS